MGISKILAIAVFAMSARAEKLYIEPQAGFESYISAAIIRKAVPVTMTMNRADADLILTSAVREERESGAGKIARCAFAYCIGIDGTQTATVQLVNLSGEVIWAYNVRKMGATSYQSSAEAIAKHLKEYLEPKRCHSCKK